MPFRINFNPVPVLLAVALLFLAATQCTRLVNTSNSDEAGRLPKGNTYQVNLPDLKPLDKPVRVTPLATQTAIKPDTGLLNRARRGPILLGVQVEEIKKKRSQAGAARTLYLLLQTKFRRWESGYKKRTWCRGERSYALTQAG